MAQAAESRSCFFVMQEKRVDVFFAPTLKLAWRFLMACVKKALAQTIFT